MTKLPNPFITTLTVSSSDKVETVDRVIDQRKREMQEAIDKQTGYLKTPKFTVRKLDQIHATLQTNVTFQITAGY